MKGYALVAAGCAALAMCACDGGAIVKSEKPIATIGSIARESLDALAGKKIFFGHQSVGRNIIDGLKDVAREKGWTGFTYAETRSSGTLPGFYHAPIGRNGDPLGKVADFEAIIRSGLGDAVDIALMKFCYVDFDASTDVEAVYAEYRDAMKRLEAEYPKATFVRVTLPLETGEGKLKSLAKRLFGRSTRDDANAARERMNKMIRAECAAEGKDLFDLAAIESTAADGSRIELSRNGVKYYSLRPEYTTDGGHLNESGRRQAAIELLLSLVGAEDSKS